MPAYSLLCENTAHSLSFASVFQSQCNAAVLRCQMVSGTRQGETHYWNLIYLGDECYYVDLQRALEHHTIDLTLLYEEDLLAEGYEWNREDYPECQRPVEQTEPTTEPVPTEPTVPTESTHEPVSTEEPASTES